MKGGVIVAGKKRTDNKGRILRTGEQQRSSDLRYLYRYTDIMGKKRTVYATTLVELREKEKEIARDIQDGIDTSRGDMTLNQLFKLYLDTKTKLRDSTRCNYKALWKNGIEGSTLGNMKIAQIKKIHVKSFYSGLTKQGLSENTIKMYHNLIYPALEMAVDSDMIRKNPAKDCKKGIGGTKKERVAMTIEEQERFMEFVRNDNRYSVYYPMLVFALSTGLRVGELTGLRWSDVDFKENIIRIRQQLIYRNLGDGCRFYVQDLKTEAGQRDIPLTAESRKSLVKQKEIQLLYGKQQANVDGISDFVFTNSLGKPYPTNAINTMLDNVVRAYNNQQIRKEKNGNGQKFRLPHISAHILRHTACTRMAEAGLDPKVLQYIMGHSNIEVTMDTYTHLDFTKIQEKMETLERESLMG